MFHDFYTGVHPFLKQYGELLAWKFRDLDPVILMGPAMAMPLPDGSSVPFPLTVCRK